MRFHIISIHFNMYYLLVRSICNSETNAGKTHDLYRLVATSSYLSLIVIYEAQSQSV
jgi:hypothetical protein